ncbi:unnamed protein product, partial [Cylicostephanus goldi]
MFNNDSASGENDPLCPLYETYTPVRFVLITLASVIACLGTAANLLLIKLFTKKKKSPSTPATLYPTILAFLDFAICLEYLLLFGVDAIVSFMKIESLFILYYSYIIPAFVASRITQLAIPYMLIFATLERLVWTSENISSRFLLAMYSNSGRYFTAIVSLLVCVALRLPTAFAIEVAEYPNCDDYFNTKTTQPRNLLLLRLARHDDCSDLSAVYHPVRSEYRKQAFFVQFCVYLNVLAQAELSSVRLLQSCRFIQTVIDRNRKPVLKFNLVNYLQRTRTAILPYTRTILLPYSLITVIIRKLTITTQKKELLCDRSSAPVDSLNTGNDSEVISLSIRPVKSVSAS